MQKTSESAIIGFLDAPAAARYVGLSLRSFNGLIATNLPCYRLTQRGKRLYRLIDLDSFMARRRMEPMAETQLETLVDSVVKQVRG